MILVLVLIFKILKYVTWGSIRGGIKRNLDLVLTNGDIINNRCYDARNVLLGVA